VFGARQSLLVQRASAFRSHIFSKKLPSIRKGELIAQPLTSQRVSLCRASHPFLADRYSPKQPQGSLGKAGSLPGEAACVRPSALLPFPLFSCQGPKHRVGPLQARLRAPSTGRGASPESDSTMTRGNKHLPPLPKESLLRSQDGLLEESGRLR